MTENRSMAALASDYLAERRLLGFDLGISGAQTTAFACFADAAGHTGPLTTRIVLDWVQGKSRRATPFSWARRLEVLRPFARYLARLDPATEFPDTAIFGRSHRRLAPHICTDQEIGDLLAAARKLPPNGTSQPVTYETIFGLIAATGLRISEALNLRCGDICQIASNCDPLFASNIDPSLGTGWSLSTSCIGGTRARSAAPQALRGAKGAGGSCASRG